jgi:predicted O-methyltransferase YrrM
MTATRTFDETLAAVAGVDGWMTDGQARRLYDAAAAVAAPGLIVEIGSFRGRSTIVLASAAGEGVEVVAIDPHAGNDRGPQEIDGFVEQAEDDHDVFTRNLADAGVSPRVRHLRRFSDAAHAEVHGQIDVLYIDGAHRYGPALHDIREWGRRVAPGGTMLIHDSFSSIGVTGAIVRSLVWSKRFTYVGRSRSLTEYRAGKPWNRLGNALNQLAQLPWFAKNVTLKALMLMRCGPLLRRVLGREPQWPY